MIITIKGKIVPYVRMTHGGKYVVPRAHQYLASKDAIAWQIRQQMNGAGPLPAQMPLIVSLEFVKPDLHRGDLDNLAKAVIDAAQGIVFKNDCWIDEISARRRKGKTHVTTFNIDIYEPMENSLDDSGHHPAVEIRQVERL